MKKFTKILLPLVIICAQLTSCSDSEEVLRGVSMGMTSSQVYAVEDKREEKGKAVVAYNARLYFDVTVFNLPCQYITYFFGVENNLQEIYCVFDDATEEYYDSLVEVLTEKYGEREELPNLFERLCQWREEDLLVQVTYLHGKGNVGDKLTLTYSVPAKDGSFPE